jgi:hypothetical protein
MINISSFPLDAVAVFGLSLSCGLKPYSFLSFNGVSCSIEYS